MKLTILFYYITCKKEKEIRGDKLYKESITHLESGGNL